MAKRLNSIYPPINETSAGSTAEPLSEREVEVLQWLASGASNREIGEHLFITESTVKRHVYHIFGKLNVHNRTQAALRARKLGINPQPDQVSQGNCVMYTMESSSILALKTVV